MVTTKSFSKRPKNTIQSTVNAEEKEWLTTVVVPYRKTTSEDIRRILNKYKIRVAFQANNTLRKHLVKLKDPLPSLEKSNCIYRLHCEDCKVCYIGQTSRQLDVRVKEHKRCATKLPTDVTRLKKLENDSAIALHAVLNDHKVAFDKPRLLKHSFRTHKQRLVTEALFINSTPDVINRSDGYELSSIWQAALHNMPNCPQSSHISS